MAEFLSFPPNTVAIGNIFVVSNKINEFPDRHFPICSHLLSSFPNIFFGRWEMPGGLTDQGTAHMNETKRPYEQAIEETAKTTGKALDIVQSMTPAIANAYGFLIGDRIGAARERQLDKLSRDTKKFYMTAT